MCWPCGSYVLPLLSVSEWGEDTCTQAHTICAQLVAGTTHPLCPTYSYLTAIGSEGAVAPMFSLSYLSLIGGEDTYIRAHTICAGLVPGTTHPLCPTYLYLYIDSYRQ